MNPVNDNGEVKVAKGWMASKTLWLNVIAVIIAAVAGVMKIDFIQQNPEVLKIGLAVLAFLNLILRFMTNQPLSSTDKFVSANAPVGAIAELKK